MNYNEYPAIIAVKCTDNFVLIATFSNGDIKRFDMTNLINTKECYAPLKDKQLFLNGKTLGKWAISWNDEVDIAAEYIFDNGE